VEGDGAGRAGRSRVHSNAWICPRTPPKHFPNFIVDKRAKRGRIPRVIGGVHPQPQRKGRRVLRCARAPGRAATGEGDGKMARQRVKVDEVALAGDFVTGMYTQSELAAKYGLSRSAVEKIVSGRRRPDVQRMIETARQAAAGRAKERLAELLSPALGVLARAMEGEPSGRAISAAKAVLDRTLGRPVPAGAAGAWATGVVQDCRHAPDLMGLTPETKRLVLQELGWSNREIDQDVPDELARERKEAMKQDAW
jgi:hypothetical protein